MNEQTEFWSGAFGEQYRRSNESFDDELQKVGWQKILSRIDPDSLHSVLECGSNIGRNLVTLKSLFPHIETSLIEINAESFRIAVARTRPAHSFKGTIVESALPLSGFDLVFTCGVLIHIAPYDLYANARAMYEYSRRYLLIAEYFARKPENVLYHGETNKLFRMDFGGFLMDNFAVRLIDYGFLWGRIFDRAGFDDITWWLFEKTAGGKNGETGSELLPRSELSS